MPWPQLPAKPENWRLVEPCTQKCRRWGATRERKGENGPPARRRCATKRSSPLDVVARFRCRKIRLQGEVHLTTLQLRYVPANAIGPILLTSRHRRYRVQAKAPVLHLLIRAEDVLGTPGHGEAFSTVVKSRCWCRASSPPSPHVCGSAPGPHLTAHSWPEPLSCTRTLQDRAAVHGHSPRPHTKVRRYPPSPGRGHRHDWRHVGANAPSDASTRWNKTWRSRLRLRISCGREPSMRHPYLSQGRERAATHWTSPCWRGYPFVNFSGSSRWSALRCALSRVLWFPESKQSTDSLRAPSVSPQWTNASPLSLMVHHFGIFEERVIDVDEVAEHLRSAFVCHRVDEDVAYPVVQMFAERHEDALKNCSPRLGISHSSV